MDEQEKITLVRTFLELPDGRKKATEHGLEQMFDKEIERLRKKFPLITFRELAILQSEQLAKQKPVTLEEARAQFLWIRYGTKGETKEMYLEKYLKGEFDFIYKKFDEQNTGK
ncbi:MAG: hypothetical protein HY063_14830 [Bacteroidetes bacterium]|nr:hypothetical protein [Bacteroidota bacterium]